MTIEIDTADHFCDDEGSISGIAVMDFDAGHYLNSDVGGVDGYQVAYCELLHVKIGNLTLSRDQLCAAFSPAMVASFEDRVAEGQMQAAA